MKYILRENWSLRGYEKSSYMLFDLQREQPYRILSKKAFSCLLRCDGSKELLMDEVVEHYLKEDIIREAREGDELCERQQYSYNPHTMLSYAQIAITGRCNYNCLHCFSSSKQERLHEEYTKDEVFDILEQLDQAGAYEVSITGGEPLLHKDFLEILGRCTQLGIKVTELLTNGSLLTVELLQGMKDVGVSPCIGISFDGLGSHNHMRNNEHAEEDAIRAIKAAVAEGFKVKATINVNQNSISRLIETCQFLVGLGCSHLFLIRTSETPKWFYSGEEFTPFDDYYLAVLDVVDVYLSEKWDCKLQIFNGPYFDDIRDRRRVYKPYMIDELAGKLVSCHKCSHGCFIAHSGKVIPCDAFEGVSAVYGAFQEQCNIKNHQLYEILMDSQMTVYKKLEMDEFTDENSQCMDCPWLYSCRGGCRAFGFGTTGSLLGASPVHCTYFRGGHADMLRELIEAHENGNEETLVIAANSISRFREKQKVEFAKVYSEIKRNMPNTYQLPDWTEVDKRI